MAMTSSLSSTSSPFTLSPCIKTLPLHPPSILSINLKTPSPNHLNSGHRLRRTTVIIAKSKNTDSADGPDRLISAVCYFYPFFDGIQYGKYVINQFSFLQALIQPLAIVLDVLLIFPDLLERGFNPKDGVGLDLLMSLDSTVFLFMLVCLIYGSSSCFLGQIPRLPIVAEAADRQVM
ncbi:hypothetical protein E3N88_15323 [Mikania micrantha]|uniref:Protein TIC 20 n=1 Tax=Mikania micrantha TaxID=192012 RepID=A0A5N6NXC3_9ASTR|nr:hypothetical protein E3N88_15323 [Mikania micrantha]